MNQLAALSSPHAPALVMAAGERATYRFLEFFTAQIRNLRIPTEAGHSFRGEAGQRSDLMSATIPR